MLNRVWPLISEYPNFPYPKSVSPPMTLKQAYTICKICCSENWSEFCPYQKVLTFWARRNAECGGDLFCIQQHSANHIPQGYKLQLLEIGEQQTKTLSNLSDSSTSIYLKSKPQSYFFIVVVKFAASLLEKFMSPGAWYQPQVSLQIYQGEDK